MDTMAPEDMEKLHRLYTLKDIKPRPQEFHDVVMYLSEKYPISAGDGFKVWTDALSIIKERIQP
jgi:hypothetical protein